jgi:hypothetical protein
MEFRWIALIALCTLLSGPMFDSPFNSAQPQQTRSSRGAKAVSAQKHAELNKK